MAQFLCEARLLLLKVVSKVSLSKECTFKALVLEAIALNRLKPAKKAKS